MSWIKAEKWDKFWYGGGMEEKRKEVTGGRRNLYSLAGSRDGAQGLGVSSPKSQQLLALGRKGGKHDGGCTVK